MPLTVQETGIAHRCSSCRRKMLAIEHNGVLMVRAGKKTVIAPTMSIQCDGCGHWNHITLDTGEM